MMKTIEQKKKSTNLIFDIGGVLFHSTLNEPLKKQYVPLERGIEMLKKCHAQVNDRGDRLHNFYVLSNWKKPNFETLAKEYSDIFKLFDGIVISGTLEFAKPDHRIYHHLLKQFQLQPSSCIFIDDLHDNVLAAQAVGMKAIHCTNFDFVETELAELAIL